MSNYTLDGNILKIGFHVSGGGFVSISALAIATILAIVLNLVIPNGKEESKEEEIAKEATIVSLSSSAAVDMTEVKEGTVEAVSEKYAKEEKTEKEKKDEQ